MRQSNLKLKFYSLILMVLLFAVWSCGATRGPSVSMERSTDNLVGYPIETDPTVTLKVWFKVGSQNDPPGKEGLAYLTGQMISEGATEQRTLDEILEALYPMAAGYNVSVDREMTVLTGRTHKDNLEDYFELYTQAFLNPKFSQEDFDRVRTDALNYIEKQLRYASDEELGKAALYEYVFEGTPYAHPSVGTVTGLKSITLEDVKKFYQTWYTAQNAVPAIGGGYSSALASSLKKAVSRLPEGTPPPGPAIDVPKIDGRLVTLVDKPNADSSISFGFPISVKRGEPDFYALWVANSWLGEHRNSSSHLYQVIREKRGMNYGDYSYIESFPNGGFRNVPPTHVGRNHQIFEVWIRTLPDEQAHFAIRAAMREIENLIENGMSQEDFDLTREFLTKYTLHFAETNSARLGYKVDDAFYGIDDPGHLEKFQEELASMTLARVNAAIKKHLNTENMKFAIVTGSAEAMKTALIEDTESPMTYATPKDEEILEEDKIIASYKLNIPADGVRIIPVDAIFEGN